MKRRTFRPTLGPLEPRISPSHVNLAVHVEPGQGGNARTGGAGGSSHGAIDLSWHGPHSHGSAKLVWGASRHGQSGGSLVLHGAGLGGAGSKAVSVHW
jgi:hypothetical protein